MRQFNIIAAMDIERGLGKDNGIPWHIPADMKWFKVHTSTPIADGKINACVMGRRTWESLPDSYRPLPDRLNVVISSNPDYELPEGVLLAESLDVALTLLAQGDLASRVGEVFVIGGAQLYGTAIQHPNLQRLLVTYVWSKTNCDCFFPEWDGDSFVGTYASNVYVGAKHNYSFKVFQKIK